MACHPPCGTVGKHPRGWGGKDAQQNYAYATSSTQVLFVQQILGELAADGRCAIVLDDGFLFRKDEGSFVETMRKLVAECDLWAIVSLPGGVFVGAGADRRGGIVDAKDAAGNQSPCAGIKSKMR